MTQMTTEQKAKMIEKKLARLEKGWYTAQTKKFFKNCEFVGLTDQDYIMDALRWCAQDPYTHNRTDRSLALDAVDKKIIRTEKGWHEKCNESFGDYDIETHRLMTNTIFETGEVNKYGMPIVMNRYAWISSCSLD